MKNVSLYAAIAAFSIALVVSGCSPKDGETTATGTAPAATTTTEAGGTKTAAVVTAHPKGSIKVGDRSVCVVCAVKEGTKEEEEVKAVLDYKDKTYGFCNESEKAEFIANPAKYAQVQ